MRAGAVPAASGAAGGTGGAVGTAAIGAVVRVPLAVGTVTAGIGAVTRPLEVAAVAVGDDGAGTRPVAVAGAAAKVGGSVSPGARMAPRRRSSRTIATARSIARPVIRIRSLTDVAPSNRDQTKYSSVPNPAFIGSNRGFCRSRRLVAPTSGISVGTTLMTARSR